MQPQRVKRDMISPMGHGNLICNQSLWDQTNIFAWALSDIRPIRLWLHNSPKMSTLLHIRMQNDEQIGGVSERERWNWYWEQPAWKLKCVIVLILAIMFFSYISWVILNDVFIVFWFRLGGSEWSFNAWILSRRTPIHLYYTASCFKILSHIHIFIVLGPAINEKVVVMFEFMYLWQHAEWLV